jgi:hypothetical protein
MPVDHDQPPFPDQGLLDLAQKPPAAMGVFLLVGVEELLKSSNYIVAQQDTLLGDQQVPNKALEERQVGFVKKTI